MTSLNVANRRRILVADDIELNRTIVARILMAADFDVDTVADGKEAVGAVLAAPYDLVLMDLDMPGLDGFQASDAIRGMSDRTGLAIVAFSVRGNTQDRAKSKAAGMDDHIARPIAPAVLVERVMGILARKAPASVHVSDKTLCYETFADLVNLLGQARISAFVSLLATRLVVFRQVLAGASYIDDVVRGHAHDLASSAGMLGFLDVSRCCQAIARPVEDDAADHRLSHLVEAVDRAIMFIAEMREQDQARVINA